MEGDTILFASHLPTDLEEDVFGKNLAIVKGNDILARIGKPGDA